MILFLFLSVIPNENDLIDNFSLKKVLVNDSMLEKVLVNDS